MIAWAIAIAIVLNALGVFAIRLAIAYAITKKLITGLAETTVILSYDWS